MPYSTLAPVGFAATAGPPFMYATALGNKLFPTRRINSSLTKSPRAPQMDGTEKATVCHLHLANNWFLNWASKLKLDFKGLQEGQGCHLVNLISTKMASPRIINSDVASLHCMLQWKAFGGKKWRGYSYWLIGVAFKWLMRGRDSFPPPLLPSRDWDSEEILYRKAFFVITRT